MLPKRLTAELSEIRRDIRGAKHGKFRIGLALTITTVLVVASGWPPGHMVERALFLVIAAIPAGTIGMGLVMDELIHVRAERTGRRRADAREVRALRAKIAEDTRTRDVG